MTKYDSIDITSDYRDYVWENGFGKYKVYDKDRGEYQTFILKNGQTIFGEPLKPVDFNNLRKTKTVYCFKSFVFHEKVREMLFDKGTPFFTSITALFDYIDDCCEREDIVIFLLSIPNFEWLTNKSNILPIQFKGKRID